MKLIRSSLAGALSCAALFFAITSASAEELDDAFKSVVESASATAKAAIASGDMTPFTELYAEDAWLLAPNAPPFKGKAAIAGAWNSMAGSGALAGLSWRATRTERFGHTGLEIGEWVAKDAGGATLDHGSYLAVWRHTSDGWRMIADTWNSTAPLPEAK